MGNGRLHQGEGIPEWVLGMGRMAIRSVGDVAVRLFFVPMAMAAAGLAAGGSHTCVIADDGNTYCWVPIRIGNSVTARKSIATVRFA